MAAFSACSTPVTGSAGSRSHVPAKEFATTEMTQGTVQDTAARRFGELSHPDVKIHVKRGHPLALQTDGLLLTAVDASVQREADYSVTSLYSDELPRLPQGMVNMTASTAGYRLLPCGEHFRPAAELRISYNPEKLPEGYTPDDIYTSFFDSASLTWVRLERIAVDTVNREIVSLTTHFTDFINELLKAPEMPETQAFVPTAMSNLEAANPMEGLTLMQPPSANGEGTANLSYPIEIPTGRGGMQPSLALTYSSAGGNGWLGVGWDISVPSITIDTRWGVPRYDSKKESETYLYRGEQMVTKVDESGFRQMPHRTTLWCDRLGDGTQFFPRINETFDSIVRHGSTTLDYWWEVFDRNGVVHRYGHYETIDNDSNQSTLRDNRGNIARWCLAESEDAYGNMIRYLYDTVQYSGIDGSLVNGRQIYPAEIHYTLHRDETGAVDDTGYHKIKFFREDNDRTRKHSHVVYTSNDHGATQVSQYIPAIIDCRNGFKEVTASLLSYIRIYSGKELDRQYNFGMRLDQSTDFKPLLQKVILGTPATETEYNDKGVFYLGDSGDGWLNFDYNESDFENIFDTPVIMDEVWSEFEYDNDVKSIGFISGASEVLNRPIATSALGMSKGFSWNVGGGATVGLGYNIFWTELAAGGNYSYSHNCDRGALSLIDIDGDGLADKVFKDVSGRIWYRKHIRLSNEEFKFGPAIELPDIEDFQETTGHNHDVGLQVSIGVSATGSRNWGKNYTTTYFSDVNADGLPDLVTDKGVYFNDLVDGIPEFHRTRNHFNPDLIDTVFTSTMPCGYIIYDGELNDSIYCTTVRYNKCKEYRNTNVVDSGLVVDFIDSNYVIDEITNATVKGHRYILDCNERSFHTGGGDGVDGWGIDPVMEAVKVWMAPDNGIINVKDTIRMQPDRSGGLRRSRYADGITYSVQWNKGVDHTSGSTHITCDSKTKIHSLSGTLSSNDTTYIVNDTTFTIKKGDILFFRLQSGQSRLFDRVDWKHGIEYTNLSSDPDMYGKPRNKYVSSEDYVVEGRDFFQAPDNGIVKLELSVTTGNLQTYSTPNNITIEVVTNTSTVLNQSIPANNEWSYTGLYYLLRGDSIKVKLTADNDHTTWGNVECVPHFRFIPYSSQTITDTLDWWIAPRIPKLKHSSDTAYNNLFGSLYRGWGQFCYLADGTSPDDLIDLPTLDFGKVICAEGLDETEMRGIGNILDYNDFNDIDFDDISSAISSTGNYNPLSAVDEGRWRRMDADCQHQAWLGYGRTTAITRTMEANVCPKEFFTKGVAKDIMDLDCPAPASTDEYPKVKTHAKYNESRTDNISVSAPLDVTVGGSYSKGYNKTNADFVDLNGDRYPDLIGESGVQLTMPYGGLEGKITNMLCTSKTKTKSGGANLAPGDNTQKPRRMFGKVSASAKTESVPDRPSSVSGGVVTGADTTCYTLTDINGDGLPDKIYADGQVALNVGYHFLTPEQWVCDGTHRGSYISGSGSASTRLPFNIEKFSVGGGFNIGLSDNSTGYQLMDINGDGLPDRVEKNDNTLSVYINIGGGNWEKVAANVNKISHGTSFSENVNVSATAGFTALFAKVTGTVSGCPEGLNFSCEKVQFIDINGDGFVDYVTSNGEDKMTVRYNRLGCVNKLKSVQNFNGARFNMDYSFMPPTYSQPQGQWVLSSCAVVNAAAKGVPDSYTTYSYRNPHYDRYERMSFGYDTVITCQHIQNAAGNYRPYRYIIEGYNNVNYQKRGKKRSECVVDSNNHRWDETLYDVVVVDLESGDTVGDRACPLVSYPLLEKTITNHYEGLAQVQLTTAKSLIFDNYRNVKKYINWGDTNYTGDELRAEIDYETGLPRNFISLRNRVRVFGGTQPSLPLMRKSEYTYDNKGGLESRTDYIDNSQTATTDYQRDVYGNVIEVTLPENTSGQRMSYTYTYDQILHRLPIRTTDAFGRSSYATYNYSFGKPLTVVDVSGDTIKYQYDLMGRVLTVTAPRELANHVPYTWRAEYEEGRYTKTFHFDTLHPNNPIRTITFCDPWGRIIQVKKDFVYNGTNVMQVSGKTQYDALGRAVQQYDPTVESIGNLLEYNTSSTALRTVTTYDILDRTVQCSTYHNSTPLIQSYDYSYLSQSSATYLETSVTDPLNRTVSSLTDAHGRTKNVTDALGGTTQYVYDAIGQLLQSRDPEGFATSYNYDLLGRVTSRDHPDAGQTLTTYDPAGNIVYQTNEEGETITYVYDFNRLVEKQYSKFPDNNVLYTHNASGQISSIQDGSGKQNLYYDELGNVSKIVRIFAVPFSEYTYTFTMEYRYDSWGRMLWMTYPDGEKVKYDYDNSGNLYSMNGEKNSITYKYIINIYYDQFGNRSSIEYGNQCHTEYRYDDLQRLTELKTYALNSGIETVIQDISYTFDNVGNITDAENTALAVGTLGGIYSNSYEYDDNNRLIKSSQSFNAGNLLNNEYSPSGRLCKKTQSFTGQNCYFGYYNEDKPHTPRRIYDPDRLTLNELLWDKNGNLAQVNNYINQDNGITAQPYSHNGSRYLFWTEDNRLTNIVDDGYFSYYAYDHSGERVLKMTGANTVLDINADDAQFYSDVDEVTLYTSPYLVANNYGYTKHYYAGTERVCARIGNGNLNRNGDFIDDDVSDYITTTYLYTNCIEAMNDRVLSLNPAANTLTSCGNTQASFSDIEELAPIDVSAQTAVNTDPFNDAMDIYSNTTQQSEEPFFYHSDHLGSASWITDGTGQPVQHIQYLPFGESFVNQHTSGYEERFTFTGKEKDSESGFYYFGARYYDCDLSGLFLSVDPMSDKYPSLSPYAYCAWNPIKIVDPNGDSLYALDASSQNDLRSIAGEYSDMLKFDDRGNVLLDYRGRDKNQINAQHEGIGLLSSIIDSDCKILYEASDIALMRTVDGSKICGYMDDKETGVMNLSTFGFDSNNSLSYLPREGYDGQVVVSLSGEWIGVENGTKNRTEIVSHELAENYARTVLGYDYNGKPSAHNYANERMKNPNKSYYYKGFKLTKTQKKQYDSKLTQYFGY